jgi:hypothetical protein
MLLTPSEKLISRRSEVEQKPLFLFQKSRKVKKQVDIFLISLAPASPLLHPCRCRALAGAALVVTRWVWRMRGTFCPQEAHRRKLSKSRSTSSTSGHLDHRHRCCPTALFLIDLAQGSDRLCLVREIRSREGYEIRMHAHLFIIF